MVERLNNYVLLSNPLYFHGLLVKGLIKSFFHKLKFAKKVAKIYDEWVGVNIEEGIGDKKKNKQPKGDEQLQ